MIAWIAAVVAYSAVSAFAQTSPVQHTIQLDDSFAYSPPNSTGIQYSDDWVHYTGADADGRYYNTLAVATTPYANLVFFFKGSYISYYGDQDPSHSVAFVSIDGRVAQSVQSSSSTAFNQLLWEMNGLDKGDHQIIISRDSSQNLYAITLDVLVLAYDDDSKPTSVGPGATDIPTDAFIIDDGHEHVQYQGVWSVLKPTSQQGFYFGGLQHTTATPGSNISFSFNGTAVWYFSDKRAQNGWAMVSVDGGEGELVSTFIGDDRWFSQVLCWGKTGLSDGEHTVTITHSDSLGKFVSLDFFRYMPSSGSGTKKKAIPAGTIAGAASGGSVLLLAIFLGLCCYIRRSRRARANQDEQSSRTQDPADMLSKQDVRSSFATQPVPMVPYYGQVWHPVNMTMPPQQNQLSHPPHGQWVRQPYPGLPEV